MALPPEQSIENAEIFQALIDMGFDENISRKASSQFKDISTCLEFIQKHQENSDEKTISNADNHSNEVKTTKNEFNIVLITREGKKKIQQFCQMTNAPMIVALPLLKQFQWNITFAVNNSYATKDIKDIKIDENKPQEMFSQNRSLVL